MAENLGLLNPYLVTGIGNTGAYTQPSQVGDLKYILGGFLLVYMCFMLFKVILMGTLVER